MLQCRICSTSEGIMSGLSITVILGSVRSENGVGRLPDTKAQFSSVQKS